MLEETAGDVVAIKESPREYHKDLSWYKSLAQVKQKTVIVYLALHGGADAEGKQPYLLPQEADVCEPDKRVWLRDILAQMAEIGDEKNKLLILDATQVASCWPPGMLHNDCAHALQSPEIKELIQKTPRLVVLCSSDVDQRSWVDEQWGCTVFAHFVAEGLRGAADRASESPNDRVTALKLARYVTDNVRRWVYNNRGELQTPVLVGGDDRAKLIELSHVRNYQPSDQGPSTRQEASNYLSNVMTAWEHCQELAKAMPAPVVYTPQRWRQYLDAMLLYEQLVRAGSDKQQLVQAELKAIEEDIRAGREKQDLSSTENAVSMPACLGLPLPWPEAEKAYDRLESLLRAPPNELEQRWQELSHEVSHKQGEQLARARLSGGLIDWVAESPNKANLDKANNLLHVMRAVGNQRSAEAHFLGMLHRDLDRTPENYWSLALKLRRLAEDAALGVNTAESRGQPYSERIFPWVRVKVEHADKLRQHGQDLLFASSAESWDEGRGLLEQARSNKSQGEGYEAAQIDAAVVREALETCHRVLAVAPYYAHWLAAQEPALESDLGKMEELLEQTHYLSRQLRGEPGDSPVPLAERIRKPLPLDPEDRRPMSLAERAALVRESLAYIEGRFLQHCRNLVATVLGKAQSSWRQLEDALTVPLLPPELRRQLLNRAEDIAREFHAAARDEAKESTAGITPDKNRELVGYRAGREGRMALATLGQKWFGEDEYFKTNKGYREVLRSLKDISPEADWQRSTRHAGEEIALRWRILPKKINELTEKSRKERLEQAELDLSLAEDLTRQLEGGLAGYLQRDPLGSSRDVRLHNFLLWQAERTWQDHWFAENSEEDPYYCAAGNRYTHDARILLEGGRQELDPGQAQARLAAVEAMEKRLVPGKLEAMPRETVRPELTDEVRFSLAYSLKPDVAVPAGAPVVWLTPDPKFLRLGDKLSQGRHVLPTSGDKPTKEEAFNLEVPPPSQPWLRPHTDEANVLLE